MSEYSFEELALESVELLPDRETLQTITFSINSAAVAATEQSQTLSQTQTQSFSGFVTEATQTQSQGAEQTQAASAASEAGLSFGVED